MDFSNLSASSILTAITIAFAIIGFIKGTFKLVLTTILLAASAIVAYLVYTNSQDLLANEWPAAPDIAPLALAITAALITFIILRKILKFILNPFDKGDGKKSGSGIFGLALGTAISLLALWFGMNQLIQIGSKQEINFWLAQDDEDSPTSLPLISRLKQTFANSTVGEKIASVAPIHDPVDHTLAKLAAMRITSTDNFTKIALTPAIGQTVLDPDVLAYFIDPEVTKHIENNNAQALLDYPSLSTLIDDKQLKSDISQIDIEQTLNLR